MATAQLSDSTALVAAALSAMTNTEIVTKDEYHVREKQVQSGIGPKYVFKGRIDVLQVIEKTYADSQELFTQRCSPQREEVVKKKPLGFWGAVILGVGGAIVGAAGLTVATAAVVITAPVSVPLLIGTAVVAGGTATGAAIGGVMGVGIAAGVATKSTTRGSTGAVPTNSIINDNDSNTSDTLEITDMSQRTPVQLIISSCDGRERFMSMPSEQYTILQLKVSIQEVFGIEPDDQCLSFHGTLLDDTLTLASYNITNNSVIKLSVRVRGGSSELFYLDDKYLDPTWDYDFTDIVDGDTVFKRGGHRYYRPCGWKRIAIKVLKKYPDGEAWLGMSGSPGEWAVTYHGTNKGVFNGICKEGYKIGSEGVHGPGVYSTPRIEIAEGYAKEFKHGGIKYKGVFQNRVNPKDMVIIERMDYRVCRDGKSIRPYGLCVKRV